MCDKCEHLNLYHIYIKVHCIRVIGMSQKCHLARISMKTVFKRMPVSVYSDNPNVNVLRLINRHYNPVAMKTTLYRYDEK